MPALRRFVESRANVLALRGVDSTICAGSFVFRVALVSMTLCASMPGSPCQDDWLAGFHAGRRELLADFYRESYATVDRAVGRVLAGPDRETVVHEVFYRVLANPELRQSFRGGSPAAWIATVARNHAIDFRRRHGREVADERPERAGGVDFEASAEARLLIERFVRDVLPAKWRPVFQACFVEHLTQREAAAALAISRTTLLYQQHRVRALLESFLLESEQ
jgi:RNA polymerase sigma-70 factor, ECF subfamily